MLVMWLWTVFELSESSWAISWLLWNAASAALSARSVRGWIAADVVAASVSQVAKPTSMRGTASASGALRASSCDRGLHHQRSRPRTVADVSQMASMLMVFTHLGIAAIWGLKAAGMDAGPCTRTKPDS